MFQVKAFKVVICGMLLILLGIPTLVLVDEERKLITNQGRGAVSNDSGGKEFPWYPKPLNKLTGATAGQINDSPSLILFTSKKALSIHMYASPYVCNCNQK